MTISFARHQFPLRSSGTWLYMRFTLSYRRRLKHVQRPTRRRYPDRAPRADLRRRAISHPAARSASSGTRRSGRGEPPPRPEPQLRLPIFTRPNLVRVTAPTRLLPDCGQRGRSLWSNVAGFGVALDGVPVGSRTGSAQLKLGNAPGDRRASVDAGPDRCVVDSEVAPLSLTMQPQMS
jgi:hypothetical protein